MLKKDIKPIFERFIEKSLSEDEVAHLRYQPASLKNLSQLDVAAQQVEALSNYLSDLQMALAINDFDVIQDEADLFIKEQFPNARIEVETELHRLLTREYVKALAYCIHVSIRRAKGIYLDETPCNWMPDHTAELQKIVTDIHVPSGMRRKQGEHGANWDIITEQLQARCEEGDFAGMKRTEVCEHIARWYNSNHVEQVQPDTIRKRLKLLFDHLGF
jgi:hypothetical protein